MTTKDNTNDLIHSYQELLDNTQSQSRKSKTIGNSCYVASAMCLFVSIFCATKEHYDLATINALICAFNVFTGRLNKKNAQSCQMRADSIKKILSDLTTAQKIK